MAVEYHNPCFDDHQFKVPFRCGIIGSSGSCKTQMLLNLIARMKDTFFHIYVVYRQSEVLYDFLAKKIQVASDFLCCGLLVFYYFL